MQPNKKTWSWRIAKAEALAGLHRKAAYILWEHDSRSLGTGPQDLCRPTAPRGGATTAYIDLRPPFIPPEHRTYIVLPSHEEVHEHLLEMSPS